MKKHISVLMLSACGTVWKLAAILAAMAAGQGALFIYTLRKYTDVPPNLVNLISESRAAWVCAAGFLLYCAVLCLNGAELHGSHSGYTIQRLRIAERAVTVWQGVYGAVCFLIFWGIEAGVMLGLCRYYTGHISPEYATEQTVFLACYRSRFLHSLVPLEEWSRCVRNILAALGLGFSTAYFSFNMRLGKKPVAAALMAVVVGRAFPAEMGNYANDLCISLLALAVIGCTGIKLFGGEIFEP